MSDEEDKKAPVVSSSSPPPLRPSSDAGDHSADSDNSAASAESGELRPSKTLVKSKVIRPDPKVAASDSAPDDKSTSAVDDQPPVVTVKIEKSDEQRKSEVSKPPPPPSISKGGKGSDDDDADDSSRRRKLEIRRREEERRRRHQQQQQNRSRSRSPMQRADRRGGGGRRRSKSSSVEKTSAEPAPTTKPDPTIITRRQQRTVDILTSKTGGAYIPPAKLRLLQAEITDKASAAYQRIAWEALKKSIHGFINKVNVDNIGIITRQLLRENIVRGRGLVCRSIIQAQAASPTFTHVYAALVSVINSKFPNIGELLLKRLVIQFKRGFRRNDKMVCLSASRFIAHLVNQRVSHEILALEILTLLVETPTDDSVEVAIAFLKESGMKLQEVSSKGVNAIFEMLKNILHEGRLDKRVQYMIEVVFQVRKDGFKDHVAVQEALELVEEDDQFTHLIMLEEATDAQDVLSKFLNTNFTSPPLQNPMSYVLWEKVQFTSILGVGVLWRGKGVTF